MGVPRVDWTTTGMWLLLQATTMGFVLPAQEARPVPGAVVVGVTGSAPDKPIGEVDIEVRRSYAALATWTFWRGAPLAESAVIRGRSDKAGHFSIPVDPGYEYEVRFAKAGYQDSRGIVYPNRPFLGFLQPGKTAASDSSEPRADRPMRVRGRILDARTGDPIAGAGLRQFWGTTFLSRSDDAGGFDLRCDRKQAEDDILVWAEGYRLGYVPQASFAKEDPIEVKLQRGIDLHGRLVDRKGRPLAGRVVVLCTDVPVGTETTYGEVAIWKKTDADGRFGFGALDDGWRYWLRTLLPSGTPCEIAQGHMGRTPKDVGSTIAEGAFSVEGRVLAPDGKPLSGGRVHVLRLFEGKPAKYEIVRTAPSFPIDALGRYRVPGLSPYPHELCFFHEGLEHSVQVVKPPSEGSMVRLDVGMSAGRSVHGKVVDAEGKAIDGALLRGMVWADEEIFPIVPNGDMTHNGRFIAGNMRVLTRPDGTFLLERLRTKVPLRIICSKEGYKTVKLRLPKTPGEAPLRIVLR